VRRGQLEDRTAGQGCLSQLEQLRPLGPLRRGLVLSLVLGVVRPLVALRGSGVLEGGVDSNFVCFWKMLALIDNGSRKLYLERHSRGSYVLPVNFICGYLVRAAVFQSSQ
jgi:hypothetical protein